MLHQGHFTQAPWKAWQDVWDTEKWGEENLRSQQAERKERRMRRAVEREEQFWTAW